MKVSVDVKIIILEGKEKGKVLTRQLIEDTITEHTEYGTIERLILEWNYLHQNRVVKDEVET